MIRNAQNHPKWLPDGSQDPLDQCPSFIFTNFWVSSGTPKSTKNPFLAKKGAPGNAFLPVLVANAAFLDFLADFCRFLVKSRCKNRCMFLHLLVFFFKLATLTKHCILRCETYFFIFCIYHLFLNKS